MVHVLRISFFQQMTNTQTVKHMRERKNVRALHASVAESHRMREKVIEST